MSGSVEPGHLSELELGHDRVIVFIAVTTLALSALLLFAHLGHYALWDDEALTALSAEGILRTGDTTAVLGKNLVGYGGGLLLRNLHDRSTPPLPGYLAAPFIAVFGPTAFAARLPFAVMGLACIALMLWWLARSHASRLIWLLFCGGLLTNVSFFLYFRNCRYYGPGIFFSVLIVGMYLRWRGRRWVLVLMSIASLALLASNYLNFLALYVCLALDYFLWARHERALKRMDWAGLVLPQAILGAVVICIWNPLRTGNGESFFSNGLTGPAIIVVRIWRDLNRCEYGSIVLLVLAPLLYRVERNPWLLRAPMALVAYVAVMAVISPTPLARTQYSDIRYLAPVIPLCLAIEVMALAVIAKRAPWAGAIVAIVVFTTNVLHGGFMLPEGVRSSVMGYSRELASPPTDPYTVALRGLSERVPAGSSILVSPNHATYPLMFHAPQYLYAWQFPAPPADQFKNLDDIHIRGKIAPDYLLVFGPSISDIVASPLVREGAYEQGVRLGHYWQDRHRPELMFHSFTAIERYDPQRQDIYLIAKKPAR